MSMTETLKGKSTRDIEENKLDTAGDFHSMLHFSAEVWTLIFIGVGRGVRRNLGTTIHWETVPDATVEVAFLDLKKALFPCLFFISSTFHFNMRTIKYINSMTNSFLHSDF